MVAGLGTLQFTCLSSNNYGNNGFAYIPHPMVLHRNAETMPRAMEGI